MKTNPSPNPSPNLSLNPNPIPSTTPKSIYLDYAATTPVDARVVNKMCEYLSFDGTFANPSSVHVYGRLAKDAIEMARGEVASYLHAHPSEIIWTSGATESDNLAIKGIAHLYKRKGKHIVTMKTEHKAVLDSCQHLEKEGYSVTYLTPDQNGLLDIDQFQAALSVDTILVSIMHVNNETGVIQDIDRLAKITSQRGILFHADATQSAGKVLLDVSKTPIDLLSLSAHKVYGPKGIGILYLRKKPRVRVFPLIHGGGHEQGMRSGTLATHQIVGMGEAFSIAAEEMQTDIAHVTQLRHRFLSGMKSIKNCHLNGDDDGDLEKQVPHILNLRFDGMIADAILANFPNLAVSTASACMGHDSQGSHVLKAMGLSGDQAKSSIRFSFGRFTRHEEIDEVVQSFVRLFNG